MKEIDLKALQGLITKEIDTLNVKYILIFIIINLAIAFINWLVQRNLKNLEQQIYRRKVREDKRITVIEEIYGELVQFTYILTPDAYAEAIAKTAQIEKKLAFSRLYVDRKLNNKITAFLDYTKSVAADFRKKNFDTECILLGAIDKEFNK